MIVHVSAVQSPMLTRRVAAATPSRRRLRLRSPFGPGATVAAGDAVEKTESVLPRRRCVLSFAYHCEADCNALEVSSLSVQLC